MDRLDSKGLEAPKANFGTPKSKLDTATAAIAGDTEDGIMNVIEKVEGGSH